MKHTPGPWFVSNFDSGRRIWIYQVGDAGQVIKTVFDSDAPDAYPMSDADARLIAAAPDLLAACEYVADNIPDPAADDSDLITLEVTVGWLREVREAVAKAEGGDE